MSVRLPAVALALLWAAPVALGAEATPEGPVHTGVLTLEEVLASVREHHPDILVARQGVLEAEGQALAALGAFDTSWRTRGEAVAQGYYPYHRVETVVEQPTPLWGTRLFAGWRLGGGRFPDYYGMYETLEAGELRAGVEVPLWRDGPIDKGRAELSKARLKREVAQAELGSELLQLQREGAALYWDWVGSGRLLGIANQLLELARLRNEQLKRRVAAGDIAEVEQVENERALRLREADRVAARRKLEQAALKLSIYLRDAQGAPVLVSPARLPPQGLPEPVTPPSLELQPWLEQALQRRPELRGMELKQEVASVDVALAQNQRAPAINVGAAVARDFGQGPERLRPTEVLTTLRLDVPLQAWGPRGRIDAAEARQAAVRAKARLVLDKVRVEVRDSLSALQAALERVGLAREAAEIAERLAQAERTSFDLGNTTLLIVNLREQLAADAQASMVRALVDYHRALADLVAATGGAPLSPG